MDVENPLSEQHIPVAKLVCIEVMGEPMERENENNIFSIHVSCNKFIYKICSCFCTFLVFIVCFGSFFMFIIGFPFAY